MAASTQPQKALQSEMAKTAVVGAIAAQHFLAGGLGPLSNFVSSNVVVIVLLIQTVAFFVALVQSRATMVASPAKKKWADEVDEEDEEDEDENEGSTPKKHKENQALGKSGPLQSPPGMSSSLLQLRLRVAPTSGNGALQYVCWALSVAVLYRGIKSSFGFAPGPVFALCLGGALRMGLLLRENFEKSKSASASPQTCHCGAEDCDGGKDCPYSVDFWG